MAEENTIIEDGKEKRKTNYLVCVNSEDYSKIALKFACRIANKNNGIVTILNVIEPADYQSFALVADAIKEEKRQETEALLQSLAEELDVIPSFMVREGSIEEEIIKVVEEDTSISMLIVGATTEANVKSKVLPQLVAQLGSKLLIPMLIVPGNITEHQMDELL